MKFDTVILAVVLTAAVAGESSGGCPEGTWLTFVRVSGLKPALEVQPTPLYSSAYGSSITAECYNRCREAMDCSGYILTYSKPSCAKVVDVPTDVNFVDSPGDAYFFKTCLTLPMNCSKKAWSVEIVPGYKLETEPIAVFGDVQNRTECMEACVTHGRNLIDLRGGPSDEKETCRSANYDSASKNCSLFATDRWESAYSFRPASYIWQEYLENSCIDDRIDESGSQKTCWRSPEVNKTSIRSDLQLFNKSLDECLECCAEEVYFRCRAVSYLAIPRQCLLHSDTALSVFAGPELSPNLIDSQNAEYVEIRPCIVSVECDKNFFHVIVHIKNFTGRVSVRGRSNECYQYGKGSDLTVLDIPIPTDEEHNRCNVQRAFAFGSYNRTKATTAVIIQRHPLIEQQGDWNIGVTCLLTEGEAPPTVFDVALSTGYVADVPDIEAEISGEWGVQPGEPTMPSASMFLLDAVTQDHVAEVTVGRPVILRIEISPPYNASLVRAHSLIAVSGVGPEVIHLLDDVGCPVDRAIFPGFVKTTDQTLDGQFSSFRFTTSTVVIFCVNLTFSTSPMDPGDCGNGLISYGRRKRDITTFYSEEVPLQLSIIVHSLNNNETSSPILQASFKEDEYDGQGLLCMTFLTTSLIVLFFLLLQSAVVTAFCVMSRRERNRPSDTISLGRDFDLPSRHVTFSDEIPSFPHRELRLQTPMKA